jgi:hypothetical protein
LLSVSALTTFFTNGSPNALARLKANHISKKNSKMIVKENKGAEDEYGKKDNSLNDWFFIHW